MKPAIRKPSRDVSKESTRVTLPGAGSDQPGSALFRGGPKGVPPTAVTDPPSGNQPNAAFPLSMKPSSTGPASQPVVPSGADMPAAQRTAPAAPAPRQPSAAPAMNYDAIRATAKRYSMR